MSEENKKGVGLGAGYSYTDIAPGVITRDSLRSVAPPQEPLPRSDSMKRRSKLRPQSQLDPIVEVSSDKEEDEDEEDKRKSWSASLGTQPILPHTKRLNEQLLMMEMELLDALDTQNQEREIYPAIAPEEQSKGDKLQIHIIKRRRIGIFLAVLFALLIFGSIATVILLMTLLRCNVVGCQPVVVYQDIYDRLLPEKNSTVIEFTASRFEDFPEMSQFFAFLGRTKVPKLSELENVANNASVVVEDGFILMNATVLLPEAYMKMLSSGEDFDKFELSNVEWLKKLQPEEFQESERKTVGPLICGRLSPSTPVLGMVPVLFKSSHLGVSADELQVSTFMDTSLTKEDIENYTQLFNVSSNEGPIGSPFRFVNMPQCCLDVVGTENLFNRLRKDQVYPRLLCETGYASGGRWTGWDAIRTAGGGVTGTWFDRVLTGSEVRTENIKAKSTMIIASSVKDARIPRGVFIKSVAAVASNAFGGLDKFFTNDFTAVGDSDKIDQTRALNTTMKTFWPFETFSYKFQFERSITEMNLEDTSQLTFARFLPNPFWIGASIDLQPKMLVRGAAAESDFKLQITPNAPFITMSQRCPEGYQEFQHVCVDSKQATFRLGVESGKSALGQLFIPSKSHSSENAAYVVVTPQLVLTQSEFSTNTRSLFNFPLEFRFRFNTNESIPEETNMKLKYLLDGSIETPNNVNASLESLDERAQTSSAGGRWRSIDFKKGISVNQEWYFVGSSLVLKTSSRNNKVFFAFEFDEESFSFFKRLEVYAKPLEYDVEPVIFGFSEWSYEAYQQEPEYKDAMELSLLRATQVGTRLMVVAMQNLKKKADEFVSGEASANAESQTPDSSVIFTQLVMANASKPSPLLESFAFSGRSQNQLKQDDIAPNPNPAYIFSYPTSVGDRLPSDAIQVWYAERDNFVNDTRLLRLQNKMQPIIKGLKQRLKNTMELVVNISMEAQDQLYSTGSIPPYLLINYDNALSQVARYVYGSDAMRFDFASWLASFIDWFGDWVANKDSVVNNHVPLMIKDYFGFLRKRMQRPTRAEKQEMRDLTPLSMMAALGSQSFASKFENYFLWRKYNNGEFVGGQFLADEIYTVDYQPDLMNMTDNEFRLRPSIAAQNKSEIEEAKFHMLNFTTLDVYCDRNFTFCGTLNATRSFVDNMLKSSIENTLDWILGINPDPDHFPFEMKLPGNLALLRMDINYLSDLVSGWMDSKKLRRSMWMTQASMKMLSELLSTRGRSLMRKYIVQCIEMMNLPYFPINDNWEMLTSKEVAVIKLLNDYEDGFSFETIADLVRIANLNSD